MSSLSAKQGAHLVEVGSGSGGIEEDLTRPVKLTSTERRRELLPIRKRLAQ